MRTKIISVVLLLTILLSCFCIVTPIAVSATSGETGDCRWNFDEDTGVLTIEGNGKMGSYAKDKDEGEVHPWNMKKVKKIIVGEGITYIGAYAFSAGEKYKSVLTSVILPSTLKKIGLGAFYGNKKLKKITLPKRLKVLGVECFRHTGLTSVKFPKSVRKICEEAFSHTKLKSVRIPSTVEWVGDYAFYECDKLKKVAICNGVKKLYSGAFAYCDKVKKIKIPATTKIHSSCSLDGFYTNAKISVSKKNKYYSSKSGILFNKKKTKLITYYKNSKRTSYKIPETVKYICIGAFECTKNIKRVSIGNNVKKIGNGAFSDCPKLKSVSMGDNVKKIGAVVFSSCKKLKSVKLSKKIRTIQWGAFKNCKRLEKIKLPDKITEIEPNAFENCERIKKLKLPSSLKKLGYTAFQYCKSLTEVKIPKRITRIPNWAFLGCKKIKKLKFSKGSKLKAIGQSSFYGCTGLKGILVIPKSVKIIDPVAFFNCKKMEGVVFKAGSKIKSIGDKAFGFYDKGRLGFPKKNFKVYGEKKNKVARAYVKESNKYIKTEISKENYKKYKFRYKIKSIK